MKPEVTLIVNEFIDCSGERDSLSHLAYLMNMVAISLDYENRYNAYQLGKWRTGQSMPSKKDLQVLMITCFQRIKERMLDINREHCDSDLDLASAFYHATKNPIVEWVNRANKEGIY